ncbi:hypothetical protein VFPPC_15049 [Pochonia chlamydosporia 170]|uniref:Uncharacterized protein n=1 Tax=Pochonia chlamydosporia 170 TaxID=1380566 RepID=A0A179G281_METCM|nr:hypothetical protein VFPPC_15049 [Pochonia chlamydosporia 170]OAQ71962.1 hypothetical protein VFPPC_15049 [Pochonia chlamydosporia 170]
MTSRFKFEAVSPSFLLVHFASRRGIAKQYTSLPCSNGSCWKVGSVCAKRATGLESHPIDITMRLPDHSTGMAEFGSFKKYTVKIA